MRYIYEVRVVDPSSQMETIYTIPMQCVSYLVEARDPRAVAPHVIYRLMLTDGTTMVVSATDHKELRTRLIENSDG